MSEAGTRLRKLQKGDLERVLIWRNSDRIRSQMYSDEIISLKNHLAWFERADQDPTKTNYLFELNGKPAGVISVTGIDLHHRKCYWGFYLGEENLPKGTGFAMGRLALDEIFSVLQMEKVYGEVFDFNEASIAFHRKLGFRQEGLLREHAFKNNARRNVILFGLLKREYEIKGYGVNGHD